MLLWHSPKNFLPAFFLCTLIGLYFYTEYVHSALSPIPLWLGTLLTTVNSDHESQRPHVRMPVSFIIQSAKGVAKKIPEPDELERNIDTVFTTARLYFNSRMLIRWCIRELPIQQIRYRKYRVNFLLEDPDLDILSFCCAPSFESFEACEKRESDRKAGNWNGSARTAGGRTTGVKRTPETCLRRSLSHELLHAVGKRRKFLFNIGEMERTVEVLEQVCLILEDRFDQWVELWLQHVRALINEDPNHPRLAVEATFNLGFKEALDALRWEGELMKANLTEAAAQRKVARRERREAREKANMKDKKGKGVVRIKMEDTENGDEIKTGAGEQPPETGDDNQPKTTAEGSTKREVSEKSLGKRKIKEEPLMRGFDLWEHGTSMAMQAAVQEIKKRYATDGEIASEQSTLVMQGADREIKNETAQDGQVADVEGTSLAMQEAVQEIKKRYAKDGQVANEQSTLAMREAVQDINKKIAKIEQVANEQGTLAMREAVQEINKRIAKIEQVANEQNTLAIQEADQEIKNEDATDEQVANEQSTLPMQEADQEIKESATDGQVANKQNTLPMQEANQEVNKETAGNEQVANEQSTLDVIIQMYVKIEKDIMLQAQKKPGIEQQIVDIKVTDADMTTEKTPTGYVTEVTLTELRTIKIRIPIESKGADQVADMGADEEVEREGEDD